MLRDLLVRVALGMLSSAIAVSCINGDRSGDEKLGVVQLGLGGIGGEGGAADPGVAGAGGQGQPPECLSDMDCAAQGDCMRCNLTTEECEPYQASDNHQCGTANPADLCDADDFCDGGSDCPDDVLPMGTACGTTATAPCDVDDTCNGVDATCNDAKRPAGFVCNPAAGVCDVAETCNGSSNACPADSFLGITEVCRPASGPCDLPEVCTGGSAECTAPDLHQIMGFPCSDSNDRCTEGKTCDGGGACSGGTAKQCNLDTQCTSHECNPANGNCRFVDVPDGTPCDDGIACTEGDACDNGTCENGVENDELCQPVPARICGTFTCDVTANPNVHPGHCRMTPLPANELCRPAGGPCGLPEVCDGVTADCPADQQRPATDQCQAASCTGAVAKPQILCSGASALCPVTADVTCNAYACDGTACGTSCADDGDCQATHYCQSGVCEVRVGAGSACESDAQCTLSNPHCVDGVCCDTECLEQCEACDVAGSEGTCSAVVNEQPHGDRPACAGDGSSCNGICAGALRGQCDFPDPQTVCQDAACDPATSIAVEQAFCDGTGSCATTDPVECEPYICGATACRGDCTTDVQCAAGSFCKAGICTPVQTPGQRCTRDAQCESGFCSDGVCCEERCGGQCEACNASGKCAAVNGAPSGMRPACAGEEGEPCAGSCDGTNRLACSYPGAAVVCREAACSDGEATVAAYCSGAGACAAAETVTCKNGCEGAICAGDGCLVASDCEAGERCVAGTCAPQGDPGAACSSASDCASGFCVDGVCCDEACDGQCEACDGSSPGTCTPIEGAPHGNRPPCTSDGSTCGGSCDGDEPDGCSYPNGTVCAPGACMPGQAGAEAVATVESQCNGSGRCPAPRQQACGGAGCDAAEQLCNGDCADGSPCPSGQYCSAGICVDSQPTGEPCGSASQCASGFCVDGYCCGSACDDRCAACDNPGQLGQCSPVTGNTHGGRPGCQGGGVCGAQCDGQRVTACSFPDEGVECGEPFCHDGTQVAASACDGAGQCRAGEATACAAFACDGDECSDACETDADCTLSRQCKEGVCVEAFLINAVDEGTCGCRVPGGRAERQGAWLAGLGLLLWAGRRRRRGAAA